MDFTPDSTSTIPVVALGVSARVIDGLRKSQSTRITRCPTCAISRASDAAVVDLPSFGIEDVNPITVLNRSAPRKSAASFIERIDSVKRDNGESTTVQNRPASRHIVR